MIIKGHCIVMLKEYALGYKKQSLCGNNGCPFYKPKGKEKTYKRGLNMEEKSKIIEGLKNGIVL